MILDWPRVWGLVALVVIGGGFGVFELVLNRRRSPRGAVGWLLVIFGIDAAAAVIGFAFLDAALEDEFWVDPLAIYVAALIWSPFLLRTQYEFLIPGGPVARDLFRIVPAARGFLAGRVHVASANYVAKWMGEKVVPRVHAIGIKSLIDGAEDFFRNLTSMPPDRRDALVGQLRVVEGDLASPPEDRIRAAAQIMIDNGAHSRLKALIAL